MHKGEDYRSEWKVRQRGDGPYADLIAARFRNTTKRLGLNAVDIKLRTDLFRTPAAPGASGQMSLFGDDP
jgi:DNA repair photolyase